jgi:capsular polysaccharide transport system ATP-binding protein
LEDLSFTIDKTCRLGIVGLNGAGKSTLINLISGALLPTSGKVQPHRTHFLAARFRRRLSTAASAALKTAFFVARIYGRDERENHLLCRRFF